MMLKMNATYTLEVNLREISRKYPVSFQTSSGGNSKFSFTTTAVTVQRNTFLPLPCSPGGWMKHGFRNRIPYEGVGSQRCGLRLEKQTFGTGGHHPRNTPEYRRKSSSQTNQFLWSSGQKGTPGHTDPAIPPSMHVVHRYNYVRKIIR